MYVTLLAILQGTLDHWPIGSREEDFEELLPYVDMAAIFVIRPRPHSHFIKSRLISSNVYSLCNLGSTGFKNRFNYIDCSLILVILVRRQSLILGTSLYSLSHKGNHIKWK